MAGRPKQPKPDPVPDKKPDSLVFLNKVFDQGRKKLNQMCRICSVVQEVDIFRHLANDHPEIDARQYRARWPNDAPDEIPESPGARPDVEAAADGEDGTDHPGGRESALREMTLSDEEKPVYRADVASLVAAGYSPGYSLAACAYQIMLARRVQNQIEQVRQAHAGQKLDTGLLEMLSDIEGQVRDHLKDLDRIRVADSAVRGAKNPLAVLENELETAEAWVREHQGEHSERCPGCGQVLIAPALPHWAFEPNTTLRGVEWIVWSTELWTLVEAGTLPLWGMAYALRTSIEGLKMTAARRGNVAWPERLDIEAQELALREVMTKQEQMLMKRTEA